MANEKSRDKSRTPMQWTADGNVGFSEKKSWITIPEDANKINVEEQQKDPDSMLSFYKELLRLRKKSSALSNGEYEFLRYEDDMISFVRKDCVERIVVALNFSNQPKTLEIDLKGELLLSNKRKCFERNSAITIFENEVLILKEVNENGCFK